ncbi:HlyD family secretion protein [Pseudobdellovibrio sp. HCB154]|uniref:HlyD family secretion protein n=1 Tax=Pseudobdellovibrio sp. HCB154 TaxID=3386277 RepID=UPI00391724DC
MKQVTSKNHNLIFASIIAAIVICGLLYNSIRVERIGFLGIADSKELQINFEYPVEVKRIHVIQGQNVRKGDLLLELDQSELNTKIREVEFNMNRLSSEIKLRKQFARIIPKSSKAASKNAGEFTNPLQSEYDDLVKEKDYLEKKKKNLYVFSPADGVVGQINFKVGEKVGGFATLMTLANNSPTFVTGFINESLDVNLTEGQHVKVRSAARPDVTATAVVKSIGRRTVEMPLRLLKYQNVTAYGREVTLALSENNQFLIGEKVVVDPSKPILSFMAIAKASKGELLSSFETSSQFSLKKMDIPNSLYELTKFEPSGAIWLTDLNKYLVISDDTDDTHSPLLFLMNRDGSIDSAPLKVSGLSEIMDIESIAQDGQFIYLLSSQSRNSSGDVKNNRSLIVKVKRVGLELTAVTSFQLRPLLMDALSKSKDTELNALGLTIQAGTVKNGDLDIEGMTLIGNDILLALKSPHNSSDDSYILRLANKDYIFTNKYFHASQVSVEAKLNFHGKTETDESNQMGLSDLVYADGTYYLSTTCKKANCSALWKTSKLASDHLKLLKTFPVNQLEGIALGHANEILGVFDEGKSEPYYFINETH